MDAILRRRGLRWVPALLICTGCSYFDRSTDRLVEGELREAKSSMRRPSSDPLGAMSPAGSSIVRPQAPEGPVSPGIVLTAPLAASPSAGADSGRQPGTASSPVQPPPLHAGPAIPLAPQPLVPPPLSSAPRVESDGLLPPGTAVGPLENRTAAVAETRVKVVATVGPDGLITDEDVGIMMRQRAADYVTLIGPEREKKEKEVYKQELRRLIERELVINEFLGRIRKNKPQLVEELWEEAGRIADRQLREIRTLMKIPSEVEFEQILQMQGVTLKSYRRQMERAALSNMYLGQFIREKAKNISLPQVQEYYASHQSEFRAEDRVKWQHIFISRARFNSEGDTRLFADWVVKSLAAGADFAKLAREYGHGDSALRNGEGSGSQRGNIQPAELESTVWSMKAGQTSGLIPSSGGFHVIRILERDVAGLKPLDDKLQAEIRQKLAEQLLKQERDKLIADLWRRSTVSVVE